VPISLYREVANELQTTKTKIEALKGQNQQLVEQNQQLRLEIERVVQVALHLRQVADSYQSIAPAPTSESEVSGVELHFVGTPITESPPSLPSKPATDENVGLGLQPERLFTEQEGQLPRSLGRDRVPEVSGWWLVLVVFVIVVTAFGMGFAILSTLMPKR
jgi:hypothetical protein